MCTHLSARNYAAVPNSQHFLAFLFYTTRFCCCCCCVCGKVCFCFPFLCCLLHLRFPLTNASARELTCSTFGFFAARVRLAFSLLTVTHTHIHAYLSASTSAPWPLQRARCKYARQLKSVLYFRKTLLCGFSFFLTLFNISSCLFCLTVNFYTHTYTHRRRAAWSSNCYAAPQKRRTLKRIQNAHQLALKSPK